MLLKPNDHVLFFGDSITDAGRRAQDNSNHGLGVGYAAICAAVLGGRLPEMNLRFSNRGISGNRVYDLEKRLDADVIDLEPSVVSILVGINDTWRRYDKDLISPVDEFTACYRRILDRIRGELSARIVLCQPFLLPIPEDRKAWREDLNPRIEAVDDLAEEYADGYLRFDDLFRAAAEKRDNGYWLPDGVHPTPAGHGLMAEAWMQAVAG